MPPGFGGGQILTDRHRARCVLSTNRTSGSDFQLWDWDGTNWAPRTSAAGLTPFGHTAYDATRGRFVVIEGNVRNRVVEFVYVTDVVGAASQRLTATGSLTPGSAIDFDSSLTAAAVMFLAVGDRPLSPVVFAGSPFCSNEPVYLSAALLPSLPFQGPRMSLPIPPVAALAHLPMIAQAVGLTTGACVATTDAVALRVQPPRP